MRLEFRTNDAGPGGVRFAGEVYDVPDDEARDLIKRRYAFVTTKPISHPLEQWEIDQAAEAAAAEREAVETADAEPVARGAETRPSIHAPLRRK